MERIDILSEIARMKGIQRYISRMKKTLDGMLVRIVSDREMLGHMEQDVDVLKRRLQRWLIEGEGEVSEEAEGLYDDVGVDGGEGLEDTTRVE